MSEFECMLPRKPTIPSMSAITGILRALGHEQHWLRRHALRRVLESERLLGPDEFLESAKPRHNVRSEDSLSKDSSSEIENGECGSSRKKDRVSATCELYGRGNYWRVVWNAM
jgi:hypothetical protein